MKSFKFKELYYDLVVLIIASTLGIVFAIGCDEIVEPLSSLDEKISLSITCLPEYLMKTGVRFLIAIFISIIFAILYASIAAKNKRIGIFLIAILDIFQSIPVLGYLSFTVTFFISLAPNSTLGVEMAIIFAIFTSQVWNMIFSVYQSLISVPKDLYEVATIYKLNKWQTFWKMELPFAIPGLLWNTALSMTSSWFFIVAVEIINVGSHSYIVSGMGAYISLAIKNKDIYAIMNALMAIIVLIFIFNELLFKPAFAWGGKFVYEFSATNGRRNSWLLDYIQNSNVCKFLHLIFKRLSSLIVNLKFPSYVTNKYSFILAEVVWWLLVAWGIFAIYSIFYGFLSNHLSTDEIIKVIKYACMTTLRIMALLILTSLIWVPVGIFIGLRPNLAKNLEPLIQFLTAMPANLYYPIFVTTIIYFKLDPAIWLSIMMAIGSQWYILYNVIGGTQAIPSELLEASFVFKLKRFTKLFKIILPAIFPFYVTGLITAAGGSWNASIVAELITWGNTTLSAPGIGSYITKNTIAGNFPNIALGLVIMVSFVIIINHLLWRPLYKFASTRFCLD